MVGKGYTCTIFSFLRASKETSFDAWLICGDEETDAELRKEGVTISHYIQVSIWSCFIPRKEKGYVMYVNTCVYTGQLPRVFKNGKLFQMEDM